MLNLAVALSRSIVNLVELLLDADLTSSSSIPSLSGVTGIRQDMRISNSCPFLILENLEVLSMVIFLFSSSDCWIIWCVRQKNGGDKAVDIH